MTCNLDGRTILVPEGRELDLFAGMLEAQGAQTLRCPLVAIDDVEDRQPVIAWLARLCRNEFDDLVLLTGEGLRRLLDTAHMQGWRAEAVAAIGRLRTIVRGPKPARVLKEIGLEPCLAAAVPTSAGVIDALSTQDLRGRKIGMQLYPDAQPALGEFLRAHGAAVFPVTPYRYASATETAAVADAIRAMAAGRVDVVAFTSTPQVRRLLEVAREQGLEDVLREAWTGTRAASVGPVVTSALMAANIPVAIQPGTSFHLKPLVTAIALTLSSQRLG